MAGRIAAIEFQLMVRDLDLGPNVDVRAAARFVGAVIGDDGVGLAVADVDLVGPIGVGLAQQLAVGTSGCISA